MRPDAALIFAIGIAFCGVVAIASGLIGQASVRQPRCRRCRADVRPFAWQSPPRCTCGANLAGPNAVRFAGRDRASSAVIAGSLMCLAAVGLAWWHIDRRERGLSWRELMPSSWEASNITAGRDQHEAFASLIRRCEADAIDARDRALAIEAILSAGGAFSDRRSIALAALLNASSMTAESERATVTRAIERIASLLRTLPGDPLVGAGTLTATIVGSRDPATDAPSSTPIEIDLSAPTGWIRFIIVESVLVDGTPLPESAGLLYRDERLTMRWLSASPSERDSGFDEALAVLLAAARGERTALVEVAVEDIILPLPPFFIRSILPLLAERERNGAGPALPEGMLYRSQRGMIPATPRRGLIPTGAGDAGGVEARSSKSENAP